MIAVVFLRKGVMYISAAILAIVILGFAAAVGHLIHQVPPAIIREYPMGITREHTARAQISSRSTAQAQAIKWLNALAAAVGVTIAFCVLAPSAGSSDYPFAGMAAIWGVGAVLLMAASAPANWQVLLGLLLAGCAAVFLVAPDATATLSSQLIGVALLVKLLHHTLKGGYIPNVFAAR